MSTFLFSFILIGLAMAGLSVGVLFGRKPIKGSCGGLNQSGVSGSCEVCGGVPEKCENLESDKA